MIVRCGKVNLTKDFCEIAGVVVGDRRKRCKLGVFFQAVNCVFVFIM